MAPVPADGLAKARRSHYVPFSPRAELRGTFLDLADLIAPTDPMTDLFDKNRPRRPGSPDSARVIAIRGAREHNLKNIDLEIPRDQLVVFTGLSGSGKSSLAFDTIYAEGQRRYVESLS